MKEETRVEPFHWLESHTSPVVIDRETEFYEISIFQFLDIMGSGLFNYAGGDRTGVGARA